RYRLQEGWKRGSEMLHHSVGKIQRERLKDTRSCRLVFNCPEKRAESRVILRHRFRNLQSISRHVRTRLVVDHVAVSLQEPQQGIALFVQCWVRTLEFSRELKMEFTPFTKLEGPDE